MNVIGLMNCPITNGPITNYPITNCPITTWQSELVENMTFFKPITIEEIVIFMIINIAAWLFL